MKSKERGLVEIGDRRDPDKGDSAVLRGIFARFAELRSQKPYLKIEDIGSDEFPLREGDDPDEIQNAMRVEAGKILGSVGCLQLEGDRGSMSDRNPETKFCEEGTRIRDNEVEKVGADEDSDQSEECELSPEEIDRIMQILEIKFYDNEDLVDGAKSVVTWERVKASLLADVESLRVIIEMEKKGHEPAVFDYDMDGFYVGTLSLNPPIETRGCVYDGEAIKYVYQHKNKQITGGSAVEESAKSGLELMTPLQYIRLQQLRRLDVINSSRVIYSYLKTNDNERNSEKREGGGALLGSGGDGVNGMGVVLGRSITCNGQCGWRGVRKIKWGDADSFDENTQGIYEYYLEKRQEGDEALLKKYMKVD